jgi:beta-glucanase (GH16 family)
MVAAVDEGPGAEAEHLTAESEPPADEPAPRPTCGGDQPRTADGRVYDTCTFTDNFDGDALDESKWMAVDTADYGFTTGWAVGSPDCYTTDPSNVSVRDGRLLLSSRVEKKPFTCHTPYGDFKTNETAGSVVSYGRFAQTYGWFEFRAKFPSNATTDFESGLWMYPQDPAYGKWPNSGEIDVANWFGDGYGTNPVFPAVHYAGENPAKSIGWTCVVPGAGTDFHTYAVDWTPTMISVYYDGKKCYEHAWTPNAPLTGSQPFDQAFDLVMTQTNGYLRPPGTTVTLEVDWVRAWK